MTLCYLLIIFLLFPLRIYAAQGITIPVGTTVYGPVTTSKANKYCSISIDRSQWTDPNATMTAFLEYSTDGGKTYTQRYGFTAGGGPSGTTGITAPQVDTATHVQARVTVTGSAITVSVPPAGKCNA